ncbi:translation initiation factor eIF 4e-like domain-containing protein [Crassisporium funariophilum]|nr:translation initiation factor eIF 4e-like domain-containing protein [Crassisporium funariophilum]
MSSTSPDPIPSTSPPTLPTTTATTTPAPPPKKSTGTRLPSLNQLAARISSNASAPLQPPAAPSAPRPRLAAFALRTGSNASISTADSMAVNAPSTRAASPSGASSASTTSLVPQQQGQGQQQQSGAEIAGGEPLTTEGLEKLNQETAAEGGAGAVKLPEVPVPVKKATKVGYKNIPSLDAITARLAKARAIALSVDGSAMPPEPEMIDDPKTPGVPMKAPEHPLQFSWTIYHDTKAKYPFTPATAAPGHNFNQPPTPHAPTPHPSDPPFSATHPPESTDYEAGLTIIGEFSTVEQFCRYFNWLKPPSKLDKNSNYHIFKSGIKPMWEDPANADGGKWVLTMKGNPGLLDRCWGWLAMALVGEELEDGDEICGAVVSLRTKVDRIQVWTRGKEDVDKLNGIGKKLVKLLDVSEADQIGLEFLFNSDDRPLPNKFLSIQAIPTTSYRSSFQAPAAPSSSSAPPGRVDAPPAAAVAAAAAGGGGGAAGGAGTGTGTFGGFGTGMGIGGQAWKAAGKR